MVKSRQKFWAADDTVIWRGGECGAVTDATCSRGNIWRSLVPGWLSAPRKELTKMWRRRRKTARSCWYLAGIACNLVCWQMAQSCVAIWSGIFCLIDFKDSRWCVLLKVIKNWLTTGFLTFHLISTTCQNFCIL